MPKFQTLPDVDPSLLPRRLEGLQDFNFYLMSSQFVLSVTVFVCLKKAVTKKLHFSVVTGQRNLMHRPTSFVVFAPVAGRDSLTYPRKSFYTCLPPPLRDHKSVRISRVFFRFLCFRKGGKYSHILRAKTKETRAESVAHCATPSP